MDGLVVLRWEGGGMDRVEKEQGFKMAAPFPCILFLLLAMFS
jgi:hypothetical protein